MSDLRSDLLEALPIVSWTRVEKNLYVGNRRGEFVGFVEQNADGSFVAFDAHSAPVGRFDTLGAAKASTGTVVTTAGGLRRRRRTDRALLATATASGAVAAALVLTAGFVGTGM